MKRWFRIILFIGLIYITICYIGSIFILLLQLRGGLLQNDSGTAIGSILGTGFLGYLISRGFKWLNKKKEEENSIKK